MTALSRPTSRPAAALVSPTDKTTLAEIDVLLQKEGIRRDGNLDYICAMFDEDYHVIGTGSCFGNTLRCFAVSSDHQGEGLLNQIITHLIEVQCARGNRGQLCRAGHERQPLYAGAPVSGGNGGCRL